jgi:hypothetical protein
MIVLSAANRARRGECAEYGLHAIAGDGEGDVRAAGRAALAVVLVPAPVEGGLVLPARLVAVQAGSQSSAHPSSFWRLPAIVTWRGGGEACAAAFKTPSVPKARRGKNRDGTRMTGLRT